MKLSHYDNEKELIRSKDIADYYERVREGLEAELKEAHELLNPYYQSQNADKLLAFARRLDDIAQRAQELSNEF